MKLRRWSAVTALAVGATLVLSAAAREKRMKLDELPPAVKATVLRVSEGLKLNELTREEKDGVLVYEAELEVDGHIRDVSIDSNGAVVLVEEEVAWESLPAAVQAAIEKGADGGKIMHVESLTRNNVLEVYEAHIRRGWRKVEFQVDPQGNPIEPK